MFPFVSRKYYDSYSWPASLNLLFTALLREDPCSAAYYVKGEHCPSQQIGVEPMGTGLVVDAPEVI